VAGDSRRSFSRKSAWTWLAVEFGQAVPERFLAQKIPIAPVWPHNLAWDAFPDLLMLSGSEERRTEHAKRSIMQGSRPNGYFFIFFLLFFFSFVIEDPLLRTPR
jgi:hypothetical protein